MTRIERAARALCSLDNLPADVKFEGRPMWESYIGEAIAAFEAVDEDSGEPYQGIMTDREMWQKAARIVANYGNDAPRYVLSSIDDVFLQSMA